MVADRAKMFDTTPRNGERGPTIHTFMSASSRGADRRSSAGRADVPELDRLFVKREKHASEALTVARYDGYGNCTALHGKE